MRIGHYEDWILMLGFKQNIQTESVQEDFK